MPNRFASSLLSSSFVVVAVVTTLALVGCSTTSTPATPVASPSAQSAGLPVGVMTQATQQSLTPEAVLAELRAGNQRYLTRSLTARDHLAYVEATSQGQYPMAVVLSCLDSRVIPELVFDRGVGDLFVARVAGNFENRDILGSMEFATAVAGAKAIVVLGHTSCGAVRGACDGAKLGNLTATLDNIQPAIEASRHVHGEHSSKNKDFVHAVTVANVDQTVRDITALSPVLADLVARGNLKVVGAMYDVETGEIRWH
jgi:carbonic anhydrase